MNGISHMITLGIRITHFCSNFREALHNWRGPKDKCTYIYEITTEEHVLASEVLISKMRQ